MTELLEAVKGSPFLLALVVLVALIVLLWERLGGYNGPWTRAWNAWRNREENRLRREARVRALRRQIAAEEEAVVVAQLRTDYEGLSARYAEQAAQLDWLMRDRQDQVRRDYHRAEFDRAMVAWINELVPRARAIGLTVDDPPSMADLADLLVEHVQAEHPAARPPGPPNRAMPWFRDSRDTAQEGPALP